MTTVELSNLVLHYSRFKFPVPQAVLELQFPPLCNRFNPADASQSAWCRTAVEVPKSDSPIRPGGQWVLRGLHEGRRLALAVTPVQLVDVLDSPNPGRRVHVWVTAVVQVVGDPHGWFPAIRFLRGEEWFDGETGLAELQSWLQEEVGSIEAVTFTSEGGFKM